jgi:hypothetical protein
MKEKSMIPTPGRIVEYTLTPEDAAQINRRRDDARQNANVGNTGFMLHSGNVVSPGDKYPLVITRAWGIMEDSPVNGQVLLDGNDTLWVTSVNQGEGERTFREYPRV